MIFLLMAASAAGTALLVEVGGGANCACGGASPLAVSPYMQLRPGDQVTLDVGARVQVVYYATGRKERWEGPRTFVVGADRSEGSPAAVAELGPAAGHDLEAVPALLRRAGLERSGQTLLRGREAEEGALDDADRARLAAARATYVRLQDAPTTDIVGEMYLAGVLLELGLASEAVTVLDEAVRTCPTCPEPAVLRKWCGG